MLELFSSEMARGSGQEEAENTAGMAITLKCSAFSSVHKTSEEFGRIITTPLKKRGDIFCVSNTSVILFG